MDLGYMEHDEPTEYFGPVTEQALLLFQRQHGLDEDGRLGAETYAVLMGRDAQNYTVMLGARGVDVTELQGRLRELGLSPEQLPLLAKSAAEDPCMVTNPVPLAKSDLEAILRDAF